MQTINLTATLGAHMIYAHRKQEVIDLLAASAFTPQVRRRIWRGWCAATMTKVKREDLDDVASPRARLPKTLPLW